ncbi:hypothetical protein ACJMK2_025294 [Sinanodonta woodiana]|uniref:TBC1 domain family member 23 n=1 Tax=Sinanodonta woodiana TaxID=1069815 RepID=A0ABD3XI13_SINWO
MAEASSDESEWNTELEQALVEECDFGTLKNICKGRPVPAHLRADVWQVCLNVKGKGDILSSFDGVFDLKEQSIIREDCHNLVDKLGNDEEEKISVVGDLESLITFYCKSRNEKYISGNGWLEILQPLLSIKVGRSEIYNMFYTIQNKFIPRDFDKSGKPFHLFRLLLLYHDPELCSFLDTKRITPDLYASSWFRELFASVCDLKVILNIWDVYFETGDPFLLFFLALVILVNAREQLLEAENQSKQQIVEMISLFPSALQAEDIEDFCSLAQYYASKTPQSFRRDYEKPLFGSSMLPTKEVDDFDLQVAQALCLPVSVRELLQASHPGGGDQGVRYFIVDCRPAEQYNRGHLPTAFHLDANLMLQNLEEFNTAVQALFAAQQQAILAGSVAGGEHLCFIGSGREEEDQYVHMVVANFLQKHHQYVSFAMGGYRALKQVFQECPDEALLELGLRECILSSPEPGNTSDIEHGEDFAPLTQNLQKDSLFGKLSNVMKSKSAEVKEKLANYIKNESTPVERHVSNTDPVGKRYRNMASVFTIGDDEEADDESFVQSSDDERREVVSLETWLNKPDVVYSCHCREVAENRYMFPSHILVTSSHMYILRDIPKKKGMVFIQSRKSLGSIVKITSKKRYPEFITFKYGSSDDDGLKITSQSRCIITEAGEATKIIKQQIMKVLETLES